MTFRREMWRRSWLLAAVLGITMMVAGPAAAGDPDARSSTVTPPTPTPAAAVTAAVDETQVGVRVTWTPGDGGGSPVKKYTVQASNGVQVEVGPTATSAVLTGMPRLQPSYFYVTVWNEAGGYAVSEPAGPVTLPSGLPTPPTSVSAVAGIESATVTWTGASGSGAAITGYIVTASTGLSRVTSDPAESVVMTDLDGGRAVSFVVQTISSRGISAESAPSPVVTPTEAPDPDEQAASTGGGGSGGVATAPARPAAPRVRVTGHKAVISWEPPRSSSGRILGYRLKLGKAGSKTVSGASTKLVFRGVSAGTYKATVKARNRAGWSEVSRATRVVVR